MELSQDGVRQLEAILESGSDLSEEDGDEKAVLQERDEAKEKLEEFEQASRALLVELNSLEAEYEIEKSCRVQAEAYAMQMNRGKPRELKPGSVRALLPMLSHPTVDFTKVSHLLYEKKDLNLQVKELQGRVQCLQEQVEEEASEKKSLQGFVKHHQQALRRVKQGTLTALGCGGDTGSVSRLVTEEYDEISRQLDLEQELRQQAEEFAHQMLVKTEEAKRQSMILMQSTKADSPLLQALDEVAKMTRALEETKRDHQAKLSSWLALSRTPPHPPAEWGVCS
uniref:Uncharacterized protein n=1 Tax=Sphaerodactylus townsendi TaxID=933632 RepID=A0ACB8E9F4_9SAUR